VATVLLTNRECPFRCVFCDLWKNTLDETLAPGLIPQQIRIALDELPPARHLKLYNAGSYFDPRAIPPADDEVVAGLVEGFESVIVESHPAFIGERCLAFARLLRPRLEVAIGLETIDPEVLPRLNKGMTVADFDAATGRLVAAGIGVRAFILLRPPWTSESAGVHWAKRSIEHAFEVGVECCVVIPVRDGNGFMDELARSGEAAPPSLAALEEVAAWGSALGGGRVLADLWDLDRFADGSKADVDRIARLRSLNRTG